MDEENAPLGPLGGKFYYKQHSDGSLDKSVAVCKLCNKEFAYYRSNSSLRYHLNAKHVAASVDTAKANVSPGNKRRSQSTLDQMAGFKTKMSKSTSERITNSLAKWVAVDCRPLSIVQDNGLKTVLQIATSDPAYELPSRKTITSKIKVLYDSERQAKENVLKDATSVAVTGDHWTSVSNSNYLGVTAHTIHIADMKWHLASFVLTVEKTNERHYAVNCADQFLSVADAWGIQQRVTTIGTDCARTMMAAARQLPFQHMPCVAHILQRTITVCLDNSEFSDVLAKCRKIVGHFKHSPANTEELHQEQTALGQEKEPLIQDVSTRWNSTLDMILRLLKNQDAVKATLGRRKHKLVLLTAAEWTKLEKLATILEPCRYVTVLLGGETYVSCSVVLPALRYLNHTMKASDEDSTYMLRFKTAFTKDLCERQATLNHDWLRIATILDPRFKDLKCIPKGEREEVWTRLEALLQEEFNRATPEPSEKPPKKKGLLLFSSDSDSDSDADDEGATKSALNLYRAEPTIGETDCPLDWWSAHAGAHPQLSVLASKYLASPATSVPCERVFSLAGNILQKKRAALSSENVNRLVCLSNWLKEKK